MTRRTFTAAFVTAARLTPAHAQTRRPVRLGGPIFLKAEDPVELAKEHRRLGYSAACCPPVKTGDTPAIRAIEKAFAR